MAFSIIPLSATLKCIDTNAHICNPERADNLISHDGTPISWNTDGYNVDFRKGSLCEKIMVSFAGVTSNDLIGTLKRGHLEVLPGIGVAINSIGNSQIPDSYCEIPMTGLYFDTDKVDVLLSQLMKIDGAEHTKVSSLFHGAGPKVETILNGVCRLCHQKTNHSRGNCPSRDICMEPNKNQGTFKVIHFEREPLCKENAIENGLRFTRGPEGADEHNVRAKFLEYGEVKSLSLSIDRKTGPAGLVNFVNIDDAERALNALKDEFGMHWFV